MGSGVCCSNPPQDSVVERSREGIIVTSAHLLILPTEGEPGAMSMEEEAEAKELQVGSWLPVLVEQVVNDTLVVTLSCGERRFTGILLDCTKK
uniref:Uncharacterized protein n=1 Tax=Sphaerodactylus townsendi TaxID=933632 RepID=A0ACB8F986_9SAUR